VILSDRRALRRYPTADLALALTYPGGREVIIGALAKTGLVTRLGDDRVRIHRLVAQVTRMQLRSDRTGVIRRGTNRVWASHLAELVFTLFPREPWESSTWDVVAGLTAHAFTVVAHATEQRVNGKSAAGLLAMLGTHMLALGDHATARTALQCALTIHESMRWQNQSEIAHILSELGVAQAALGDLDRARRNQDRAGALLRRTYGGDHPKVAIAYGNRAIVARRQGDLAEAREYWARALKVREKVYGPSHPEVARTLINLSVVDEELGRADEALTHLRRALAIKQSVLNGEAGPEVARLVEDIAALEARRDGPPPD
jgi:tetratricopeptide (TPR) repeat protein